MTWTKRFGAIGTTMRPFTRCTATIGDVRTTDEVLPLIEPLHGSDPSPGAVKTGRRFGCRAINVGRPHFFGIGADKAAWDGAA
jgi:hypothetical protein